MPLAILNYDQGQEARSYFIKTFDFEIELLCLNSEFMEAELFQKYIKKALNLFKNHPNQVLFSESEFHLKNIPYYELSLFCNKNDLEFWKDQLTKEDFIIDIIHELNI